jgi:hypothetical protein
MPGKQCCLPASGNKDVPTLIQVWFHILTQYTSGSHHYRHEVRDIGLSHCKRTHKNMRSVIKVVRFGLNIACFPDEHAVELVEKQIARQREREWRENEGYGQA